MRSLYSWKAARCRDCDKDKAQYLKQPDTKCMRPELGFGKAYFRCPCTACVRLKEHMKAAQKLHACCGGKIFDKRAYEPHSQQTFDVETGQLHRDVLYSEVEYDRAELLKKTAFRFTDKQMKSSKSGLIPVKPAQIPPAIAAMMCPRTTAAAKRRAGHATGSNKLARGADLDLNDPKVKAITKLLDSPQVLVQYPEGSAGLAKVCQMQSSSSSLCHHPCQAQRLQRGRGTCNFAQRPLQHLHFECA